MRIKTLVCIFVLTLLAAPVVAAAQQQPGMSLGELARKNRSEKPKKVITNEDIPSRPADESSSGETDSANGALVQENTAQPEDTAAADKKAATDEKAKESSKDADAAKAAYEKAKAEVDKLKQRESDLQRGMAELEKNRDTGSESHRQLVDETLAEQRDHLAATTREREEKEKALEAMTPPPQQVPPPKKDQ